MSTPQPPIDSTAGPGGRDGLRGAMLSGASWKALSQTTLQVLQILTTVILSRILGPREFGLVAMVTVFTALIFYFTDLAQSAALVQRPEITHAHCATAFWTNVVSGTTLMTAGILASGLVADFYHEPRVGPIFAVMSVNLLVLSLGKTQGALMARGLRFRSLEIRSIIAGVVGAVVGVTMAVLGFGAWALVAQVLTISVMRTGLVWIASDWRPSFTFSRQAWRDIRGFSRKLLVSNILYFLNGNADNLIVGKFLGAVALGIYRLSYTVMLIPINRIVIPIRMVLFPVFSRMGGDRERMLAGWLRVNHVIAGVTLPGLIGLVVTAPDFVPVMLGHKWHAAIPVLQVLAVVGMLQSYQRLNDGVLLALGRTGRQLAFAASSFVLCMTGFLVGVQFGVIGVAAGAAIANGIVQPAYMVGTARALDSSVWPLLRRLHGVFEGVAVMGAAVLGLRLGMTHAHVPALIRFVVEVPAGAAVYLLVIWLRDSTLIGEFRSATRGIKRKIRFRGRGTPALVIPD